MSTWNKIAETDVIDNQAEFTTTQLGKYAFKKYKASSGLYLYNLGDECTETTGGWKISNNYQTDSWSKGTPTLTKNADNMYIGMLSTYRNGCIEMTNEPIDLTPYSKLYIDVSATTLNMYGSVSIKLVPHSGNWSSSEALLNEETFIWSTYPTTGSMERTVKEIDISSVNQSVYLYLWAYYNAYMNVYRVWLE